MYISIICENFVFLDSMMFLNTSLDALVSRLKASKKFQTAFGILIQYYGREKGTDMCRRGVDFYDYVKSFDVFKKLYSQLRTCFKTS